MSADPARAGTEITKPAPALVHSWPVRLLLRLLAVIRLGIVGVFVLGLPTTVFVLIAARAAACRMESTY